MKSKKAKPRCATNADFADIVGIHFSMASKMKHGQRGPSLETLIKIWRQFGLPANELLAAAEGGPETFGMYLREKVFLEDIEEEFEPVPAAV